MRLDKGRRMKDNRSTEVQVKSGKGKGNNIKISLSDVVVE